MDPELTLTGFWEAWKRLGTAARRRNDEELSGLLVELTRQLTQLGAELDGLRQENHDLRGRLRESSEFADLRSRARFDGSLVYLDEAPRHVGRGPHCSVCFHRARKFQPLSAAEGAAKERYSWICPSCNGTVP